MPTNSKEEDESRQNQGDTAVPQLTRRQHKETQERTSVSAIVVHEAVRREGEEELRRPISALAWSGLAAGLSMGFSFVAEGLLHAYLPGKEWRPLIVNLGYSVGFLLVVIGRQQLFTENTLTAIIPLLARRDLKTLVAVIRLWTVVLIANMVGAHIFAWAAADTGFLKPEVQKALTDLARESTRLSFQTALWRGVFAGWLIAMMVWMNAATNASRVPIIVILTYIVSLAGLTHVIAGSVEVIYLVLLGDRSWFSFFSGYMLPTLIGNILGGVALVSVVNHAQVVAGSQKSSA